MPSECGLCGVQDGPGVGAVCWVCEPPIFTDPSYPTYVVEQAKWRDRLWRKARAEEKERRALEAHEGLGTPLGVQRGSLLKVSSRKPDDEEFVLRWGESELELYATFHRPAVYRFWDFETLRELTEFVELELERHTGPEATASKIALSGRAWFRLELLRVKFKEKLVIVQVSYV